MKNRWVFKLWKVVFLYLVWIISYKLLINDIFMKVIIENIIKIIINAAFYSLVKKNESLSKIAK
jgi:hypothetical protein